MRSPKLINAIIATLATSPLAPSPATAGSCSGDAVRPAAGNLDAVQATTLCLLNSERATHGLPALVQNASLTRASNAYSEQMVGQGFFDHVSPDGRTLVQRLTDVRYLGRASVWLAGENIAWAQGRLTTPGDVMTAWMASPGHRANILERRFRKVGLGVALGSPDSPTTPTQPTSACSTAGQARQAQLPAWTPRRGRAQGQARRSAPCPKASGPALSRAPSGRRRPLSHDAKNRARSGAPTRVCPAAGASPAAPPTPTPA